MERSKIVEIELEFERMLAQDPELRREYEQLRRIGLLMSSGPEVEVK